MHWTLSEERDLRGYTIEWAEPEFFILSKRNRLFQSRTLKPPFTEIVEFPASQWKRGVARMRLAQRLLRFMFYNVLKLPDQSLFLTFGKDLGIYAAGTFHKLEGLGRPFRVLRAACALDGEGRVSFGEYLPNAQRGPVDVYQFIPGSRRAEIVHRFPAGSVRHVHGIYHDPYSDHHWCVTGDRKSECRVITTADNFRTLQTVGEGDETWRCVSLQFTRDAVYYATDAEFEQNYLYRIDRDAGARETLTELEGPVYYSHAVGDHLFFAVSAELCPSQEGRSASLWHVGPGGQCTRVFTMEKDAFPLRYFMPGTVHFPQGPGVCDQVFFHVVALRGGDNRTFSLRQKCAAAI
jgi:hypothetical protein